MANVIELLDSLESTDSKTWVAASMTVENGEYVIRIPAKVSAENLKVSSTGKSLVMTARVETGRDRHPMVVNRADGTPSVLNFGSFNISLSLRK